MVFQYLYILISILINSLKIIREQMSSSSDSSTIYLISLNYT